MKWITLLLIYISMTFEYKKVMSMNEARELLVESIQTLLNLINSNPENSKYFEHFPAPIDIVLISILGETCPQNLNCVEVVKIIQGTVYYNINHPIPHIAPYLTLKEESFEEAQDTLPNQLGKEVKTPTLRWIFQIMEGIALVRFYDASLQGTLRGVITNLNKLRRKIIILFGETASRMYELIQRNSVEV